MMAYYTTKSFACIFNKSGTERENNNKNDKGGQSKHKHSMEN